MNILRLISLHKVFFAVTKNLFVCLFFSVRLKFLFQMSQLICRERIPHAIVIQMHYCSHLSFCLWIAQIKCLGNGCIGGCRWQHHTLPRGTNEPPVPWPAGKGLMPPDRASWTRCFRNKGLVLSDESAFPICAGLTELRFTLPCFQPDTEKFRLPQGVNHAPEHKYLGYGQFCRWIYLSDIRDRPINCFASLNPE